MAYGPSFEEMRGAALPTMWTVSSRVKPADLPVEQPSRFEFVINRKMRRCSASRSPTLLFQADEVIQ